MVLRAIFRAPLGIFDVYSNYRFSYPRAFNFYFLYGMFGIVLFFGKGFEKINFKGPQNKYEFKRRARHFFIPYSVIGYKWRFPVNK